MTFEWDEDNPTLRAITTAAYRARCSPPGRIAAFVRGLGT
jgi:hypothetical protein